MKKKLNKKIIFVVVAFLLVIPFSVLAADIQAIFSSDPLFQESNLLSEDTVRATADIYNLSSETKKIFIQAVNVFGDEISDGLNFVIKNNGNVLWQGILADFFDQGEVSLFDVVAGDNKILDLAVSLNDTTVDQYGGKSLGSFDLVFGFLGEEDNQVVVTGSGGGGGGSVSLNIYNIQYILNGSEATITWDTNLESTSQVVYAEEGAGASFDPSGINYGYQYASSVFDEPAKINGVLEHEIVLDDLKGCQGYYYRVISKTSARETTSGELYFKTECLLEEEEDGPGEQPEESITEGEVLGDQDQNVPNGGGGIVEIKDEEQGGQVAGEKDEVVTTTEPVVAVQNGDQLESDEAYRCSWCPWSWWICWLILLLILFILWRVYLIFKKK